MTTTLEAVAPAPAIPARRGLGFAAVLAAMIMNILDGTIVNVAAPSIRADLGGSLSALQWIVAAYTLALAAGLLAGGRLGDMFGRRRMMLTGLAGFVAASVFCAAAVTPGMLIGGRAAQGLFAALVVPQAFGLLRDLYGADIGRAFAALGPVIGLSTIAGPVLAGVLIELDPFGSDWRSIFLINLPIGLFALIAGWFALPSVAPARAQTLDLLGTVIAAAFMVCLVYPLVQGRELGWPVWVFGVAAAAVALIGLFAWQQVSRTRAGRTPLVEFSVLRRRSYAGGVLFVIVFIGTITGLSLALGLFLQVGQGFSAIRASLTMAALAVGAFVGSGVAAATLEKAGRRILHVGLAVMAVGTVVLVLALNGSGVAGFGTLSPGLVVFGTGMGMIFVPLFDIVMGEVADHEVGSAAGLLESLQQLGAALGIAVLATVFFSRLSLGTPAAAAQVVLLITLGLTLLAFAIGFLLPRKARAAL